MRCSGIPCLETGQDVRGCASREAVELIGDQLAWHGLVEGLAHGGIGEERVRGVHLRALAIDLLVRVGEVDVDPLDAGALFGNQLAGGILAVGEHPVENRRLDLQVPGVVVVTSLEHGAGRRWRIATTLDVDRGEERLVGFAVVLVRREPTRSFGTKSVITKAPVPIGKSRKSGLLAAIGSSLKAWAGRMVPLVPPVNGSNQVAAGVVKVTTAVNSSGVSTFR